MTSDEIYTKLLERVIPLPCQESYARSLAAFFSMHLRKNELMDTGLSADDLPLFSALVIAPTGQGKTFLLRQMAEAAEVPLIIIDCTTLCHEGWKGTSLSQYLQKFRTALHSDFVFKRSVIFFDETDKMKFYFSEHDQGNPMETLLQMFNNGEVLCGENMVSTGRMSFLFGGAFDGLEKIIEQRLSPKRTIGFGGEDVPTLKSTTAELLRQTTIPDLVEYGLMPELLGRIGSIVSIDPLGVEDYRRLLTVGQSSVQNKYRNLLQGDKVDFLITEAGMDAIAQHCMTSTTGARAVNPLVDNLMRDAILAVERDDTIIRVLLDAEADACTIRCEHGQREQDTQPAPAEKTAIKKKPYTIKAHSIQGLAAKLCYLYARAGGKLRDLEELYAFLNCALTYLYHFSAPEDFTIECLMKLALITAPSEGSRSAFDVMVYEMAPDNAYKPALLLAYREFSNLVTDDTPEQLAESLERIGRFVEIEYIKDIIKIKLQHSTE